MVKVTTLTPRFAACIEGVDAAHASDADIKAIKAALLDHVAIVLPDQNLPQEAHAAFAARFGPLETYPHAQTSYNKDLRQDVLGVSNSADGVSPMELEDRRRLLDIGNKLWHSDSSFQKIPGHLSMLYGVKAPSEGGETQIADLRAGYDALSNEMKHLVEHLAAEHSATHARVLLGFDDWNAEQKAKLGAWVTHNIVRTLPETGRKTLYLSSHASHIVGMPVPIGRMLLHELTEIATAPHNVYTHRWRENDLLIWDNRCALHRARRFRSMEEPRVMRRVTTLALEFPARDPATVHVPEWALAQAS